MNKQQDEADAHMLAFLEGLIPLMEEHHVVFYHRTKIVALNYRDWRGRGVQSVVDILPDINRRVGVEDIREVYNKKLLGLDKQLSSVDELNAWADQHWAELKTTSYKEL